MEKAPAEPNEVDSSVSRSDDGGAEAAQPGPLPEGKKSDALPTANDIGSIPNGGLVAWLQVLGSFVLFVNSWGIVNTFGAFQTFYNTTIFPDVSPSSISWIGSIQAFLLMFIGTLTGPIYDGGYFRHLVVTGTFLISFGIMMLSLCTEFWQVVLCQAIVVGLGTGCLFVPSVAILSTYFTTHIGAAVGFASAGSSIGGVVYPIMLHKLEPKIGFPWAVRVFGFIIFTIQMIPVFLMKMRVKPPKKRPLTDFPAFKHLPYTFFILGVGISFMGLYVPFFYSEVYAYQTGIFNKDLAFYTLAILNGVSTLGRIVPNIISDTVGPFNVIIPCALFAGVMTLSLLGIHNVPGFVVFLMLYGFFSGSFVSLPPSVLIGLSPNRNLMGTHMGMAFAGIALGALTGTPIGGQILKTYGYRALWIYGGTFTCCGAVFMFLARGLKLKWENMWQKV